MIIIPYILFVAQKDDFVTSNVKFYLIVIRMWLIFLMFQLLKSRINGLSFFQNRKISATLEKTQVDVAFLHDDATCHYRSNKKVS